MARYGQRLRQAQGLRPCARHLGSPLPQVVEGRHTPWTTRRATRLVLKQPMTQTDEDTPLMAHLKGQHADLAMAIELAQDVAALVRARQAARFDSWLARATASAVAPLRRFATGRRTDDEAVTAGRCRPWRNGPVAGQSNRVKRRKRSMVGRATIDLLSRRCLRAA